MMVYLLYLHLPPKKKKRNAGKYTVRPYRMVWDSQPDQLICKKKTISTTKSILTDSTKVGVGVPETRGGFYKAFPRWAPTDRY